MLLIILHLNELSRKPAVFYCFVLPTVLPHKWVHPLYAKDVAGAGTEALSSVEAMFNFFVYALKIPIKN